MPPLSSLPSAPSGRTVVANLQVRSPLRLRLSSSGSAGLCCVPVCPDTPSETRPCVEVLHSPSREPLATIDSEAMAAESSEDDASLPRGSLTVCASIGDELTKTLFCPAPFA